MFGKRKPQQNSLERCSKCGHYLVAPGPSYTTQANAQRFERVGGPDAPLTQTWPPKPQAVKSATRTRIEQSIAVGVAASLCPATCALSVGQSPSLTALAALGSFATLVSSSTFVLSVALGADNWQTIFRWLDRNKDGRITRADIEEMFNDWFGDDDESEPARAPILDNVQMGYEIVRRIKNEKTGQVVYRRAVLLPKQPRYLTADKLNECARLYFDEDGNVNFSKNQCGAPFGDDIGQAQDQLEKLGYLKKNSNAYNAVRNWTVEGERWLKNLREQMRQQNA